jgi:hypothetical protein
MSMPTRQRLIVLSVGFAMGCVIVGIVLRHRGLPHRPQAADPGVERRMVPGVLSEWTKSGKPIEGDFIVSEAPGPLAPDGSRTRGVVVPGLDPDSFVRIEEEWAPGPPSAEPTVRAWKFMFADRVRAKLRPGTDTKAMAEALKPLGWHFSGRGPGENEVTIALGAHLAATVPTALVQLQKWPQWIETVEPDYLPPPAERLHGP